MLLNFEKKTEFHQQFEFCLSVYLEQKNLSETLRYTRVACIVLVCFIPKYIFMIKKYSSKNFLLVLFTIYSKPFANVDRFGNSQLKKLDT